MITGFPEPIFITLVSKARQPLLGELVGEEICLSDIGRIIDREWQQTGVLRPEITLDEYVIMPNHFHAIPFINETFNVTEMVTAHRRAPLRRQPRSLGAIVAGFKSMASQRAGKPLGSEITMTGSFAMKKN